MKMLWASAIAFMLLAGCGSEDPSAADEKAATACDRITDALDAVGDGDRDIASFGRELARAEDLIDAAADEDNDYRALHLAAMEAKTQVAAGRLGYEVEKLVSECG